MANGVDPDQIGAVCSGSTLFASILNVSVMLGNYLQQTTSADDFSRRHCQMRFFLGALRDKTPLATVIDTLKVYSLLRKMIRSLRYR